MRYSPTLLKHGLASARIGIEYGLSAGGDFAALRADAERVFGRAGLLARLRQIKTPDEIDIMRKLSRIADRPIHEAFSAVRVGDNEMDLAGALTRGIYAQGAEYFKLMIIATGERTVFPECRSDHAPPQCGDVCRVEIFPMIDGYHVGVCRTAVVEKPRRTRSVSGRT